MMFEECNLRARLKLATIWLLRGILGDVNLIYTHRTVPQPQQSQTWPATLRNVMVVRNISYIILKG